MAMLKEKQNFDLEFFMKSTDVGLYDVAKEIFSYLNPWDLQNMEEIGKKNKTFDKFLEREEDFLWKKFAKNKWFKNTVYEKATLKIRYRGLVVGRVEELQKWCNVFIQTDFDAADRLVCCYHQAEAR